MTAAVSPLHFVEALSALAALTAAAFWWKASVAFVPAPHRDDGEVGVTIDGAITFLVGKKRAMLFATLQLQSDWNRRAASAAAISAALQAGTLFLN